MTTSAPPAAARPAGLSAPSTGPPGSIVQVRVWGDRIEVLEQLTEHRTRELIAELRRLGLHGEVGFRTPCG